MDVNLHGVLVRFVDAQPPDVRLVQRQLSGVNPAPCGDSPDLTVRFVDALPMHGEVRRVGEALCDDEGVVLVRAGGGRSARARIPQIVGSEIHGELVCERHVREVPLLLSLIRVAALRKRLLPLHAVAFTHRGVGVAAAGWSGSGKTALLLSMLRAGAHPIAAEWVLVSEDGRQLLGIPQPVRLKPSHVARWPELAAPVRSAGGARRRVMAALQPVAGRLVPASSSLVQRALHVDVALADLPGSRAARSQSGLPTAEFDVLVLLEDAEVGEPRVEPLAADLAAERIAVGLERDFAELHSARQVQHYATGRPGDDLLNIVDKAHRELLASHLATRKVLLLRHQQPTSFDALRTAVDQAIA